MYFIVLFIASWVWFLIWADKKRIRELFGVAAFASFLGLFTDLLMVKYKLWSYKGLPQPSYLIPLLLDFSVYPVVSYLFMQRYPLPFPRLLLRISVWTILAVLFEWLTLITDHMEHHEWWSLWLSLASDIVIYSSFVGIYHLYRSAYAKGSNQS